MRIKNLPSRKPSLNLPLKIYRMIWKVMQKLRWVLWTCQFFTRWQIFKLLQLINWIWHSWWDISSKGLNSVGKGENAGYQENSGCSIFSFSHHVLKSLFVELAWGERDIVVTSLCHLDVCVWLSVGICPDYNFHIYIWISNFFAQLLFLLIRSAYLKFHLGRSKIKVTWADWLIVLGFNATLTAEVISWRSMMHICFLAFSDCTNTTFFPVPPIIFSHASEMRGENMPERKFAATRYQTHNLQVFSQRCSPLSFLGGLNNSLDNLLSSQGC